MDSVEVSSADIARLAGVRPTAVSNWRRRHSDFPAPVGGTEKSPRFSLDEVREWLARQGRSVDVGSQREFEHAVSTAAVTTPIAEVLRNALLALLEYVGDEKTDGRGWEQRLQAGLTRLSDHHPSLASGGPISGIDAAQVTMLNSALDAVAERPVRALAADLYDEVVAGRLGKGDSATPAELAELMVELAEPDSGPFFDLACGAGSILMAAARHGCCEIIGMEANASRAQLAALRLRAEGFDPPVSAQIVSDNALESDPFGPGKAAAVATNPPFNDRNWAQGVREDEPWWGHGLPSGRDSELAWLQRALFQLRPGGTAVLVMPPSAAWRPSGRRIRRRLLSEGVIRAVFALPRGSLHGTGLAPHLWLLSAVSEPVVGQAVLMADFSGYTIEPHTPDWGRVTEEVLAAWSAFKGGGDPSGGDSRVTSVMTIFEDGVDLTPGRYLPLRLPEIDLQRSERLQTEVGRMMDSLTEQIGDMPQILPELTGPLRWETIETLERDGEVSVHRGLPVDRKPKSEGEAVRVVRAHPSDWEGYAKIERGQHVPRIREGDILATAVSGSLQARSAVAGDFDSAPALGTVIIRTDPRRIDPGFFTGFLTSALAQQQVVRSSTSTGVNLARDLLRIRVPLPNIEDQQRYAVLFTSFANAAEDAAVLASRVNALTTVWRDGAWSEIVGTKSGEGTAEDPV